MKLRILLGGVVAALAVFIATAVVQAQRPAAFDLKFGSLSGAKELGGVGGSPEPRRGPESNRCTRLCRPLRSHSATAPNGARPW